MDARLAAKRGNELTKSTSQLCRRTPGGMRGGIERRRRKREERYSGNAAGAVWIRYFSFFLLQHQVKRKLTKGKRRLVPVF